MLPKKHRVDKKTADKIFKNGRFINSHNLTFRFLLKGGLTYPRISFMVPKKIAKLAVKRNFLRRRGYSILEKHLDKFPAGLLGVFVFKKCDVFSLENEIKEILSGIN